MPKFTFEVPVEVDELSLSILGWEADARVRITADDWESKSKLEYTYGYSATLRHNLADWTVRYQDADPDDWATSLVLELECEPLGEALYREVLTGEIRKIRRSPLRMSDSRTIGYSLPRVDPAEFKARLTTYDAVEASTRMEMFERAKAQVELEVLDERYSEAISVNFDHARAYRTKDSLVVTTRGNLRGTTPEALEQAVKNLRWYDEDETEAKLPMPQMRLEVLDETGFILYDEDAPFHLHYPWSVGRPIPARPARWFLQTDRSLDEMTGTPVKVVVRLQDGEE